MSCQNYLLSIQASSRLIVLTAAICACTNLAANPGGADVVSGSATFSRPSDNVLNVTNSPGAIINWQDFSIQPDEVTRFIQQSGSSAVLNRVVGNDLSHIQGKLLSNGRVFLINPHGVVFGPDAVVDTAGFIASTLNLADEDFLQGNLDFEGNEHAGSISNQGLIKTGENGDVLFIAPDIETSGIIKTEGGNITLVAGASVRIISLDDSQIQFDVQAPEHSVINLGQLLASGGNIEAYAGTLQHSGQIIAERVVMDEQGHIVLKAQHDIELMASSQTSVDGSEAGSIQVESSQGTTWVAGNVTAMGDSGEGGSIRLLGEQVALTSEALIDATGTTGGGEILVGGDFQGNTDHIKNAKKTIITDDVSIRADAMTSGDGGKVIIWADEATAFAGKVSATGGNESGNGGFVEISGKQDLMYQGHVDTTATNGEAGKVLFDPTSITIGAPAYSGSLASLLSFTNNAGGTGDAVWTFAEDAGAQTISVADVLEILGSNGSLTLQASDDITVNNSIDYDGITSSTLTLQANDNIVFSGGVSVADSNGASADSLNLNMTADADTSGAGNVILDATAGTIQVNTGASGTLSISANQVTMQGGNGASESVTVQSGGNTTVTASALTLQAGSGDNADVTLTSGGDANLTITNNANFLGGSGNGSDVTWNVTGNVSADINGSASFTAGSGVNSDVDLNAGTVSLLDVAGDITIQAGTNSSSDVNLNSNAGFKIVAGNDLNVTGAGNSGNDARINATQVNTGILDISVGRDFNLTGGNGFEADANVVSSKGTLTANIARDLNMIAQGGTDADVELESDGNNNITVGRHFTGTGGSADGTFIEIDSYSGSTTMTTLAGNIALTGGTNQNAGSYIDANQDVVLGITGNLTLTGGGSTNSGAQIEGNNAVRVDTTGNITVTGGSGANSASFIGNDGTSVTVAIGNTTAIGGNVTLTGGGHADGVAVIGSNCSSGGPCNATVSVNTNGMLTLDTVTGEAVIGSRSYNNGDTAGSVAITSNGILNINDGAVRTPGNLSLNAPGNSITQLATGQLRAAQLTASAANAISLLGTTNDISRFTGTVSGAGNLDLTNNATLDAGNGTTLEMLATAASNGNVTLVSTGDTIISGDINSFGAGAVTDLSATGSLTGTSLVTATNEVKLAATTAIGTTASAVRADAPTLSILSAASDLHADNTGGGASLSALNLTGGLRLLANGAITQTGALVVAGTSTFNADANSITLTNAGNNFSGGLALSNSGNNNVQVQTVAAPLTLGDTLIGNGIYTVTGATSVTNNGTMAFANGAQLTVPGTFTNNGTIMPGSSPGLLTINGNYAQTAAGKLIAELGGTDVGITYDLLNVTGTANLNGGLDIQLFGTYTGTVGDTFDILTATNITGDFASISMPATYTFSNEANTPTAGTYRIGITEISSLPSQPSDLLNPTTTDPDNNWIDNSTSLPNDDEQSSDRKNKVLVCS